MYLTATRPRNKRGPEGVPEHDQLPLVLDGDEAVHPVFCVSVHSFLGVVEDFTSASRQADLQLSLIHSRAWSLVLGVLFPSLLVFQMPTLWDVESIESRLQGLLNF
jgi:hypothetical protein